MIWENCGAILTFVSVTAAVSAGGWRRCFIFQRGYIMICEKAVRLFDICSSWVRLTGRL
jgi:hypothetical protein